MTYLHYLENVATVKYSGIVLFLLAVLTKL